MEGTRMTAKLMENRLNEIHKKISMNETTRKNYKEIWAEMIRFLEGSWSGFKINAIVKSGSIVRQTENKNSDLDILIGISENNFNTKAILAELEQLAWSWFDEDDGNSPHLPKIHVGPNALHLGFDYLGIDVDLVPATLKKIPKEKVHNELIYDLPKIKKRAVRLVKWAFNSFKSDIHNYEIALNVLHINENGLVELVTSLINYFRGRIEKAGSSVDQVLTKLQ